VNKIYLVTWVRDALYLQSGVSERSSQVLETFEEAEAEVRLHIGQDPIIYEAHLVEIGGGIK